MASCTRKQYWTALLLCTFIYLFCFLFRNKRSIYLSMWLHLNKKKSKLAFTLTEIHIIRISLTVIHVVNESRSGYICHWPGRLPVTDNVSVCLSVSQCQRVSVRPCHCVTVSAYQCIVGCWLSVLRWCLHWSSFWYVPDLLCCSCPGVYRVLFTVMFRLVMLLYTLLYVWPGEHWEWQVCALCHEPYCVMPSP